MFACCSRACVLLFFCLPEVVALGCLVYSMCTLNRLFLAFLLWYIPFYPMSATSRDLTCCAQQFLAILSSPLISLLQCLVLLVDRRQASH
jgi:hypothetical protein